MSLSKPQLICSMMEQLNLSKEETTEIMKVLLSMMGKASSLDERIAIMKMLRQHLIPTKYDKLTITPISKDIRSNSSKDYNEQLRLDGWCWDDSEFNKSVVGHLFAFFFPKDKVVIHKILEIHNPSHRLPSWTKNVGQSDRNVLELSEPLKEFTMDEWRAIGGQMKQQGTYTSDLNNWKYKNTLVPALRAI